MSYVIFFSSRHVRSLVRHFISLELVPNLSLQKPLQHFAEFSVRQWGGKLWELSYDVIFQSAVDLITLKAKRIYFTLLSKWKSKYVQEILQKIWSRGCRNTCSVFHNNSTNSLEHV
jgi:hypothetical protein